MNKLVCYTCCTGGYDDILQPEVVNPEWDYVFFTDDQDLIRKKQVGQWEIRPLVYNQSTNVKNARWHKVNAHLLFPEYQASLWIDANIKINSEKVLLKVQQLLDDNVKICVPLHPERSCIYHEARVIIDSGIDYEKVVNEEIEKLKADKYPENNGLHETCIVFRRHNEIKPALDLWWNMIQQYSKRDQLSFDYVMWKNQIEVLPWYPAGNMHRNIGEFMFRPGKKHNQNVVKRLFQIVKKPNGSVRIYLCGIKIFSYKKRGKK